MRNKIKKNAPIKDYILIALHSLILLFAFFVNITGIGSGNPYIMCFFIIYIGFLVYSFYKTKKSSWSSYYNSILNLYFSHNNGIIL